MGFIIYDAVTTILFRIFWVIIINAFHFRLSLCTFLSSNSQQHQQPKFAFSRRIQHKKSSISKEILDLVLQRHR